jgi:hypothetical protein
MNSGFVYVLTAKEARDDDDTSVEKDALALKLEKLCADLYTVRVLLFTSRMLPLPFQD